MVSELAFDTLDGWGMLRQGVSGFETGQTDFKNVFWSILENFMNFLEIFQEKVTFRLSDLGSWHFFVFFSVFWLKIKDDPRDNGYPKR